MMVMLQQQQQQQQPPLGWQSQEQRFDDCLMIMIAIVLVI
jgi:hypothetical protein